MIKRFYLMALLIVSSLPAFPQQDKPIITVLDFTVNEVSQAEMKSVIGLLSSALFKTNCFTVIDVSQRETVLKELQFSMSGCTDESCMLEIGKMLAAEAIVVGNLSRLGSKYVFSAKMLETETARTLSTADGIFDNLDALLMGIAGVARELAAPYGGTAAAVPAEGTGAASDETGAAKPERVRKPANIPGILSLSGAVACAGTGAYFLVVSLPFVLAFNEAKTAYYDATDVTSSDITALWNAYEAARVAAVDENANTNFLIGASLAGTGLALGILSVVLFTVPAKTKAPDPSGEPDAPEGPEVSMTMLPFPGAATLSFRCRF